MMARHLVSSGFSNDLVHFLNLLQGSLVSTQSLLGQLLGSLLTGVSDQLDQSSLVWGQAGNLRNNASNESGSLGKSTLSVRDLWGNLLSGGLVALVQTDSNSWGVSIMWWKCGTEGDGGQGKWTEASFFVGTKMQTCTFGSGEFSGWFFGFRIGCCGCIVGTLW